MLNKISKMFKLFEKIDKAKISIRVKYLDVLLLTYFHLQKLM